MDYITIVNQISHTERRLQIEAINDWTKNRAALKSTLQAGSIRGKKRTGGEAYGSMQAT